MAHHCPTCSEPCYCMGDYDERMTGQPAYCKHCTDYSKIEDEDEELGEPEYTCDYCCETGTHSPLCPKNTDPYNILLRDGHD